MKVILKIIYNFICKIIIKLLPLLRILRLQTLVIDQLSKIRLGSNKYGNIQKVISELPQKRKLIALDVGAQGGFNMEHFFLKKYENFFNPIMVEPIPSEAEKLKKKYTVIEKGLWSTNCIKKLYVKAKLLEEHLCINHGKKDLICIILTIIILDFTMLLMKSILNAQL